MGAIRREYRQFFCDREVVHLYDDQIEKRD